MGAVNPRFKSLKLAAIWVVGENWYSPFQGNSRVAFVPSDPKSEELEKIGNISLESHTQIFEEIARIQVPV